MARLRLQAPVRRPSSKETQDPVNIQNIWEFNELKYKGRLILLLVKKGSETSVLFSIFDTTQDLKAEIKISLFTATAHTQHTLWTALCMCGCFLQVPTIHGIVILSYQSEH